MARTQYARDFSKDARFVIPETPIGLTIAGSDCCAGAGLQIDLKTFQHHGVYGLSVVTAIVAEVPGKVIAVQPVSPQIVDNQLRVLLETYPIGAAKTGMFHSSEQIRVAVGHLKAWKRRDPSARLVVDPVMVATSGTRLLEEDAIEIMKSELLPLADLVTPNLPEATVLLGRDSTSRDRDLATELSETLNASILLKGGHAAERDLAIDYLVTGNGLTAYETERLAGATVHGTGCALSASITAQLAKGLTLEDAVGEAKSFLTNAMRKAFRWSGDVRALAI